MVFQVALSVAMPYFPNVELKRPIVQSTEIEELSFWDRLTGSSGAFSGVAVLPYPEDGSITEEQEEQFPNIDTSDITDLSIGEGLNPFESFAGIMGFQFIGAEMVGIVFWLSDILVALCVIKLIRNGGD